MRLTRVAACLAGPMIAVVTMGACPERLPAVGPDPIPLWTDGAPGAIGEDDADRPEIRVYQPQSAPKTGTAVVVCPGGGYGALAIDHEGQQVAKWFNSFGVTGVVLKYRLGPRYRHPAPLQDVQRAIRYTRAHADELGIDAGRVGVMGFSAGGHLASTVSTHFDAGDESSSDPIEQQSCRPDFAILAYPVISLTADFSHRGSARNLLGDDPDPELLESLSNETQVTAETPPTFLFHTGADKGVPVQNSLAYYGALVENGVAAELHVYQNGPHGVGLAPGDPVVSTWADRLKDWLQTNNFLSNAERAEVSGTVTVNGKPLQRGTVTFIPVESAIEPAAFARVSAGKYSLTAESGPVAGESKVVIYHLGDIAAVPTVDDAVELTAGDDGGGSEFRVDVSAGRNVFDFDLKR